ncbi:endonuclease [Candidatus Woesearchaeota archaeon]|nr:endonuclease [Candidatus Woesearchaeota archaeon]
MARGSDSINRVYSILYSAYGPQGWWPLTPEGSTRTEHHAGPPKTDLHRFEIILGAILTQNTAWTNVENALEQLHKNRLLDPQKILRSKHGKLAKLIRSAGYFNQKAERLQIISGFMIDNSMRSLKAKDTQELRSSLLDIKGIGPETADSIVLYAFEKPSFVIDAYTKRIFSRIGICEKDIDYHGLQDIFHNSLRPTKSNTKKFQEYHALIVEHAKQHCKTRPVCQGCPLTGLCKKKI